MSPPIGFHFRASERLSIGEQNHYAVLFFTKYHNVPKGDRIDNFFCKLVKKVHPDVHRSAATQGALKAITEAWQVLSDPSVCRDYDLRCGFSLSPPLVHAPREISLGCYKDSSAPASMTGFPVSWVSFFNFSGGVNGRKNDSFLIFLLTGMLNVGML